MPAEAIWIKKIRSQALMTKKERDSRVRAERVGADTAASGRVH